MTHTCWYISKLYIALKIYVYTHTKLYTLLITHKCERGTVESALHSNIKKHKLFISLIVRIVLNKYSHLTSHCYVNVPVIFLCIGGSVYWRSHPLIRWLQHHNNYNVNGYINNDIQHSSIYNHK